MSDCQFKVEGQTIYAHKIILVNASYTFAELLSSNCGSSSNSASSTPNLANRESPSGSIVPIVAISDIRYDIFMVSNGLAEDLMGWVIVGEVMGIFGFIFPRNSQKLFFNENK